MTESIPTSLLPQLSCTDSLFVTVFLAFIIHMVFKHYEPLLISVHFVLLGIPPAFATVLLAQHLPLWQAALSAYTLFYVSLAASILIYRISPIHPLARYPGPLYLKTSKLWMAWIASSGKQHLLIQDLHEKYGDAVRIGPNEVSFRDATTIVPLMGSNGLAKGPLWEGRATDFSTPALIATPDQAEHSRRRKTWNRAFSSASLKEYEEIISGRVTELVDLLANKNEVVDLNTWFGWFTFDFMSDMAFGGGSEMMRDGDKDHIWHILESGLIGAHILGHVPWLAKYAYKIPGAADSVHLMRSFAIARASARIKAGSSRRDLFHYLNDEDGVEASPPPFRQVVSDAVLAIVAGSDTTAGVLTTLFYCLLRHPEMYKRLQEEVDKYYPPEQNALDTKYHTDMPYMNAIINETLRLYPAVPSGSQRRNRDKVGRAIGPYYLPPWNQGLVHFWSVHRDPRNFSPAPDSFWPDRWLIAAGDAKYEGPADTPFVHNLNAFIPFSFGPSNCVGKNLAMQEMRMVVCMCMQKLEMQFAEGWNPEEYDRGLCDFLVSVREKMPVTVRYREKA